VSGELHSKTVWYWCHASLGCDLVLRHPPEVLAIAFVFGAANDLHGTVRA
jgi:hypothetical protein